MALTDTALKALKPKDKPYIVSDDRGLYVEVFPTGGIVWRFRYRLNGQREKLTLGKYPALTLKNARLMRDGAAQVVAIGQSPGQKKQLAKVAGPEDATVAEFAQRFFKDIQERDRKDNTMTRRYLEKDILPHIGDKPIKGVTAEDVRSVICASNVRRQFKIALHLILLTLVRKSELMLARWKDVHLNKAEWHIPVENSKTGKPHIVYLSTQAQALFRELKVLASSSE